METTMIGFVLGIFSVIFSLMVVGIFWAIKNTSKITENFEILDLELDDVRRELVGRSEETYRRVDEVESVIYQTLDSRLDKLENRLKNQDVLNKNRN